MRSQDAESYRQQSLEDEKKLDTLHPVLKQLAQANVVLSGELAETTQKIADVVNYTADINGRMAGLSRDFERTRKKIEVAGLSQALGQVLLEERRRLLGIAYTGTQNLVNQEKIAQVGLRQIQNEEERQNLANSRAFITEQISGLVPEEAAAIIDSLRDLADKRRVLLDRVVSADQNYLQALSDLDFSLRQMRDSAESYRNFITERLLWIRSSQGLNTTMTLNTPQQVLALVSTDTFDHFVVDLQTLAIKYWPGMLLGTFCLLLLFWERRNLRESLKQCAVPLKRLTTDNFLVTIKAVCISLLLAAPLSIVLIFLGFTLQKTDGLGKLASALGPAAWDIGRYLLLLQLLRQLSKQDGVFRAHFKWKEDTVTHWFTGFNKLLYLLLPALFLTIFLINFDFGSVSGGLAHVSFTISMVVWAHCLVFFLSDSKATTSGVAESPTQGESGLPQSGRLTRFLFVLVPVCLALFGLAGYLYTASTLCLRILDSISLVVVLVAAHQLVLRWLLLAERKLAYQNALERRAAMRQKASETQEEILGEEAQIEIEEPKIDLEAVSKGGKELLRTIFAICGALGIWFI
ncbi:MAG: hypothetical protein KDA77_17510, partial [Planctomycetaceae bacterium]|nr:hypothetical protein [Planctomycetaceae bacterium]